MWPGPAVFQNKYLMWMVCYMAMMWYLRPVLENDPNALLDAATIKLLAYGMFLVVVLYGLYKHHVQQAAK